MDPGMPTFKLTLAYEGTGFAGWQRQRAGGSIQGLMEDVLEKVVYGNKTSEGRSRVVVSAAGRTDAGVHATAQVASVRLDTTMLAGELLRAVNAHLPPAVRIVALEDAAPGFHARYAARTKTYAYRILNARTASAFDARYAWHVTHALDADVMRNALVAIVGRHDFAAFRASGSLIRDTVRWVSEAIVIDDAIGSVPWLPNSRLDTWSNRAMSGVPGSSLRANASERSDARLLTFRFTADGFLRHMVRNLVGTVVDIGRGRWPPEAMAEILASRDRARAGPTAPPEGLFLVGVRY
jgi:tRNA pseudouridine38-40 synthase